jgi:putative transposase
MKPASPFRYFNASSEVIRSVVMMYVRYPLSLRNVEDLLFERGINLSYETVPFWWSRLGPLFAADIRRQRISRMKRFKHWRWYQDVMHVKVGGEMRFLWHAVGHEGEILESYVTKIEHKKAVIAFIKKA